MEDRPINMMMSEIARHAGYNLSDDDKTSVRDNFLSEGGDESKLLLGSMGDMTKMRMALADHLRNMEKESSILDFDWISAKLRLASVSIRQKIIKSAFYNGPADPMRTPQGRLDIVKEEESDFDQMAKAPGRDVIDFTLQDTLLNALSKRNV